MRVTFHTSARELSWEHVLSPGRAVCYTLLDRSNPELGAMLHEYGYGSYRLVPFGYSAPVFRAGRKARGTYPVGGPGVIEFGSPLPEVIAAWAQTMRSMPVLAWGPVAFIVDRVELLDQPGFDSGTAVFRTSTPVVMKGSGRSDSGERTTRQAWVLPGEPEWDAYFERNLRRKAETLGLDSDVTLESVTWLGPRRAFAVAGRSGVVGKKPGACVEVAVSGAPETLRAIHSWGLGQANATGMGWIESPPGMTMPLPTHDVVAAQT
ncbi:CRISPR-associated protein Cas6 [Nocardia panacis]|uniref:CRISPR-associated protein Cas6 n=1 Tax=Nocardia panacis TaxID=2340916 RepID=A0A3A4KNY4_9NOCA|nr:CRISPR-associated endoribonuclease Cas6 [Nocardia panacis]RJO79152.1 CRISPR-associated protein Cas6 [Nocardia panacis]